MAGKGKLFLIPTIIAEDTVQVVIPQQVLMALKDIRFFLAENPRTARRYLSSLKIYDAIESLTFEVLNKETKEAELSALMAPSIDGFNIGVISESGCPGVADPGSMAVRFAHQNGISVVPLVGPSSIVLALMASGLNGQSFAFHGYLPVEAKEAARAIRELEKESNDHVLTFPLLLNAQQIFSEKQYSQRLQIRDVLRDSQSSLDACRALVDAALEAGARDNVTVTLDRCRLPEPRTGQL